MILTVYLLENFHADVAKALLNFFWKELLQNLILFFAI